MTEKQEYKTIKYFKASQLGKILKSEEAEQVINNADSEDNIAVLLTITNPAKVEKAANITKEGFGKLKEIIPM